METHEEQIEREAVARRTAPVTGDNRPSPRNPATMSRLVLVDAGGGDPAEAVRRALAAVDRAPAAYQARGSISPRFRDQLFPRR
jgi:hypothetical protein